MIKKGYTITVITQLKYKNIKLWQDQEILICNMTKTRSLAH